MSTVSEVEYLPSNTLKRKDVETPFKRLVKEHIILPIYDEKSNKLRIIDPTGKRIGTQTGTYQHRERYPHLIKLPLHLLSTQYIQQRKFWFVVNDELHMIVRGQPPQATTSRLISSATAKKQRVFHHIKYLPHKQVFVPMDDIVDDMFYSYNFAKCFYNPLQEKLYMLTVKFEHDAQRLADFRWSLCCVDDIDQFQSANRWKVHSTRRWEVCFEDEHMQLDNTEKLDVTLRDYRVVIVYDSLLLVLIFNKLVWIDLNDYQVYLDEKLVRPELGSKKAHVFNFYDDYVYFMNPVTKHWYRYYLPHIIPMQLMEKYRRKMQITVNAYVGMFAVVPQVIIDLICSFTPCFLYF